MTALVKTEAKMDCRRIKLWGQNIEVYDQYVFVLTDAGLHDEEGRNTTIDDPLTAYQSQTVHFLYFIMKFHPYQADSKCKYRSMT